MRQRSLQNGKSGSFFNTSLRQVGHRKLRIFFLGIELVRLPTQINLATRSYSCASVISQR